MRLENKKAIITGAASGFGAGMDKKAQRERSAKDLRVCASAGFVQAL